MQVDFSEVYKQYAKRLYLFIFNKCMNSELAEDVVQTAFLKAIQNIDSFHGDSDFRPHEAGLLRLDCDKIKNTFGWAPLWNYRKAVAAVVEWSKVYLECGGIFDEPLPADGKRSAFGPVSEVMEKQIAEFCGGK